MKFPKHTHLYITHNGHCANYETIEEYLDRDGNAEDMDKEDVKKCIHINEIWEVQWYPITPISFYWVGAATLERCLEIIENGKWD